MLLLIMLVVALFGLGVYGGVHVGASIVLCFLWILYIVLVGPFLLSGGTISVFLALILPFALGWFTIQVFQRGIKAECPGGSDVCSCNEGEDDE